MRKNITPVATVAATAVGAGTALARKVASRRLHTSRPRLQRDADPARRRSVTVFRRIDEIRDATPPALAALGPAVEIAFSSAPDGKGTVLTAHLTEPALVDADPAVAVRRLRQALRDAKQQLEIGWTVTPTRSEVTPTPLNRPLREAEAPAQGGGLR